MVTSIIDNKECVFTSFDNNGVCYCAIENAYKESRIDVQKPISCHLYPIRIKKYQDFIALQYEKWHICDPAIENGKKKGVLLYQFLREALVRKFGEDWYEELCIVAEQLETEQNQD